MADFAARIEPAGPWVEDGDDLTLPVTVTNAGRAFWPAGLGSAPMYGIVTLGPYVPADDGRVELPRHGLPRSLSPGESVEVAVRIARAAVDGASEIGIDAVREGISWFADYGSSPLVVQLPGDE